MSLTQKLRTLKKQIQKKSNELYNGASSNNKRRVNKTYRRVQNARQQIQSRSVKGRKIVKGLASEDERTRPHRTVRR